MPAFIPESSEAPTTRAGGFTVQPTNNDPGIVATA
jgi:hypothetical protein